MFSPNTGKYSLEKTPYMDTFYAVHHEIIDHIVEQIATAAIIFVNTIQYPRTLNNNIYHLNKQEPPPFFHSITWPRSGPLC